LLLLVAVETLALSQHPFQSLSSLAIMLLSCSFSLSLSLFKATTQRQAKKHPSYVKDASCRWHTPLWYIHTYLCPDTWHSMYVRTHVLRLGLCTPTLVYFSGKHSNFCFDFIYQVADLRSFSSTLFPLLGVWPLPPLSWTCAIRAVRRCVYSDFSASL